jgi:hypothetical protein
LIFFFILFQLDKTAIGIVKVVSKTKYNEIPSNPINKRPPNGVRELGATVAINW